jgi:hypothetical protein
MAIDMTKGKLACFNNKSTFIHVVYFGVKPVRVVLPLVGTLFIIVIDMTKNKLACFNTENTFILVVYCERKPGSVNLFRLG